MAITHRGTGAAAVAGSGTTTSIAGNIHASTTDGDVMWWAIVGNNNTGIATPAGWTVAPTVTNSAMGLYLFWRVAASEPASYTATVPSGRWTSQVTTYAGVDTVTPQDVTATTATASSNPPAITPTTAGAWVVGFGGGRTTTAGVTATWTSADATIRQNATMATGGTNVTHGSADASWTSGALDLTLTCSQTLTGPLSVTIALRPSTGAPPPPNGGAGGGGTAMPGVFDGVNHPLLLVTAGFGGTLDPGAAYIHLGVGPGLGTGLLSGVGAGSNDIDITPDVRSISISQRGRSNDIDQADPVTCTLVLNNFTGDYDPTNAAGPYSGQLEDGIPIRVRAIWDGVAYDRFYGELAGITLHFDVGGDQTATFICTDGLEKLGRAYIPQTGNTGDGVTTGVRVGLVADQASYPTVLRDLDDGYTTLAATLYGATALELCQQAANTEYGLVFVDGGGSLVFFDRHHGITDPRSTTVQVSFTVAAADAKLREFELARNRDRTFNRVAITRDPVPVDPTARPGEWSDDTPDQPVEQVADDLTSQTTHGVLAFGARAGQLARNDSDALALAQYLVGRYSNTQDYISGIGTTMLRGPRDQLLNLRPLDRVSITYDYGPNTITAVLHIQGAAEDIRVNPAAWDLVLSTTNPPPDPNLWIIGTSQVGVDTLGW